MLRLLADENLNQAIVRGVLRQNPLLDLARVQDVGLNGMDDPAILEWAANDGRLVLTHDANTMPGFAFDRVRQNQPMPGIFIVSQQASLAVTIADILLVAHYTEAADWNGHVTYLPLT